jgi:FAS-associated factor 2
MPLNVKHLTSCVVDYLAPEVVRKWLNQTLFAGALDRKYIMDPKAATQSFIRKFHAKYDADCVPFYTGNYSEAVEAAKRELRFLVVYLHSPEHDGVDTFCRNVLVRNEALNAFIREKDLIFWGGDVSQPEACQVSDVLYACSFPFLSLICNKNGRMQSVSRLEEPKDAATVLEWLTTSIETHGLWVTSARAERAEREAARRLREEQDEAYQASLRADQEKERKAREQREAEQRAQQEQQEKKQTREERRQHLRDTLPAEPEPSAPGACKVVFRLP